uniref:Uncharacterized protein n=1 Tax=Setaria viridis TaxID=4556 RepID=A0A4U6UVQ5_SETVI|nr:hypothetical protein SEVIR_4G013500v2 [Setaria viridis]
MGAVANHDVELLLEVRSLSRSETKWVAMLHGNMLNMHATHQIMGLGVGRSWQVSPLICFCPRLVPVGVLHSSGVLHYGGSHPSPDAGWYCNSEVIHFVE